MKKRELIQPNKGDKRFIRRDKEGQFTANQVDVGKSLSADRRSKAKTIVAGAKADCRLLLLDLPTLDGQQQIIAEIRNLEWIRGLFDRIDYIVIAQTFGFEEYRRAWYFIYDRPADLLTEVIEATFA